MAFTKEKDVSAFIVSGYFLLKIGDLGISGSNQTRYPSLFCLRGIENTKVFLFSHAVYSNVGLCNNMVD